MTILLKIVLLGVGFLMLIKGADWFVEGASGIVYIGHCGKKRKSGYCDWKYCRK